LFKKVKWQEAPANNRRFFDEKKFFQSLKDQTASGKNLSEKQLSVLKRIAEKYADQLLDKEKVFAFLGIEEKKNDTTSTPENEAERNEKIKAILAKLSQVSTWAPPIKNGRFTYDDKAFYQSIAKQFENGKQLSDKQLNALQKLSDKY
jgi:hypothetical protein